MKSTIEHQQKTLRNTTAHDIELIEESILYKIIGEKRIKVNSNHKQSVNRVGENLLISAHCVDDGVVEGIESVIHDFVVGIEWHPEMEASSKEDNLIFKSFIDAASRYKNKTR